MAIKLHKLSNAKFGHKIANQLLEYSKQKQSTTRSFALTYQVNEYDDKTWVESSYERLIN